MREERNSDASWTTINENYIHWSPRPDRESLGSLEVEMRKVMLLTLLALFLAVSPLMAQTKRIPVAFSAVKNFLMAYSEGVSRLFKDKEFTMKVIDKYTRTDDREVLVAAYSFSTNFIEKTPKLPYKAIETILAQTA